MVLSKRKGEEYANTNVIYYLLTFIFKSEKSSTAILELSENESKCISLLTNLFLNSCLENNKNTGFGQQIRKTEKGLIFTAILNGGKNIEININEEIRNSKILHYYDHMLLTKNLKRKVEEVF
ncbi:MAG: hypothetical protein WCO84_04445 [bacterium]